MVAPKSTTRRLNTGFTIVELLIVVVVIAILAAITIVSYNGISNRAKASAAQTAAKQAYTKLSTYSVTNSDRYPETLDELNLAQSDTATYQYRFNNDVSPATFCVTATTDTISYYISATNTSPTPGACAGHAADGATLVTNLVHNPRMVQSGASMETYTRFGWVRSFPSTGDGPDGIPTYMRLTVNNGSVGYGRGIDWYINPDITPNDSAASKTVPVTAGENLTISAWVRTSRTAEVAIGYRIHNGTAWVGGAYTTASATSVPSNQWTRISRTVTIGTTGYLAVRNHVNAYDWVSTDHLDQTGLMITKSNELLQYGDGTSDGWDWSGEAQGSVSSGPAL